MSRHGYKPIAADIPRELFEADEVLTRYGRSVMDRFRKQHCASAEGKYSIPPNDDDRAPREVLLSEGDTRLVQRALLGVPDLERTVLQILYVPQRQPAEAQLRLKRISPETSCQRHIAGLRVFASRYHVEWVKAERAQGGLMRIRRRSWIEGALSASLEDPTVASD